MKYCQALRERSMPVQTRVLAGLGIGPQDILMQQAFAGMLKPSYVLVRDHKARCVVLAIRGTHSVKVLLPLPSNLILSSPIFSYSCLHTAPPSLVSNPHQDKMKIS